MSVMNPGISVFFSVTVDAFDLGDWTKMSGIGMSIQTDDRPESAMNFFEHHMPKHMHYEPISLERPVSPETGLVMAWISAYHLLPIPTAGEIRCLDQHGAVLMTWSMFGVSPVSWKGPNMDASANHIAVEVLTFRHMGFM
jgi:phage tail-like protein